MTSEFNVQSFSNFIIENRVLSFYDKPVKLKSGQLSSWYINWRSVTNDLYLYKQLLDFTCSFVRCREIEVDCFYGVPEGATKLALGLNLKYFDPSSFNGTLRPPV